MSPLLETVINHVKPFEGNEKDPLQLQISQLGYDDYIAPAKVVNNYAKDSDFYKIKAGVMDQKMIDVAEVKKLATLPSKETLYAMLASALLGNIRNLAVVLDQTRQKKEENA